MPIEMADGTTMYMDMTGMKSSEIEKLREGIFEFTNGEMNWSSKKNSGKIIKTKSKPEKSRKLKN